MLSIPPIHRVTVTNHLISSLLLTHAWLNTVHLISPFPKGLNTSFLANIVLTCGNRQAWLVISSQITFHCSQWFWKGRHHYTMSNKTSLQYNSAVCLPPPDTTTQQVLKMTHQLDRGRIQFVRTANHIQFANLPDRIPLPNTDLYINIFFIIVPFESLNHSQFGFLHQIPHSSHSLWYQASQIMSILRPKGSVFQRTYPLSYLHRFIRFQSGDTITFNHVIRNSPADGYPLWRCPSMQFERRSSAQSQSVYLEAHFRKFQCWKQVLKSQTSLCDSLTLVATKRILSVH